MYETYPPRNAPTGFLGGGTVPMLGVAGAAASERTTRVVERALLESAEEAGRAEAASRRTAVDMVVIVCGGRPTGGENPSDGDRRVGPKWKFSGTWCVPQGLWACGCSVSRPHSCVSCSEGIPSTISTALLS